MSSGSRFVLQAARVITPGRVFEPGAVSVDRETGTVLAVGPPTEVVQVPARGGQPPPGAGGTGASSAGAGSAGASGADPPAARLIDLGNRTIAPGYVDVHVHGGDGAQVNGDDADEVDAALLRIAAFHATHGTTTLLATTVADSRSRLLATVEGIARATRATTPAGPSNPAGPRIVGPHVAGIHLEGPFIARARTGAQDPNQLREPDLAELDQLIEAGGDTICMLTLAPELPNAGTLIARALEAGITVALGHTDADFDTAEAAFDAGASHLTHLFNAMPPLHHRRPGVVGSALRREGVTIEVIADLEHIHPAVLEIVARLAAHRLVAVSDATPAAGLGAGRHRLGSLDVVVSGTRVELAGDPATLAGSLLTMDQAVSNLVLHAGMTLPDAIATATRTPGRLLGASGLRAGEIVPGHPADLVVLEPDLHVAATIVGGALAHDPLGLLGPHELLGTSA